MQGFKPPRMGPATENAKGKPQKLEEKRNGCVEIRTSHGRSFIPLLRRISKVGVTVPKVISFLLRQVDQTMVTSTEVPLPVLLATIPPVENN
jgi:hypothetical protein